MAPGNWLPLWHCTDCEWSPLLRNADFTPHAALPLPCLMLPLTLAAAMPLPCPRQDPAQKVRGAAAFALGQFSEYLQPEIVQHYEAVLPALFGVMEGAEASVQVG